MKKALVPVLVKKFETRVDAFDRIAPTWISIGSHGDVYVICCGDPYVHRFSPNGTHERTWCIQQEDADGDGMCASIDTGAMHGFTISCITEELQRTECLSVFPPGIVPLCAEYAYEEALFVASNGKYTRIEMYTMYGEYVKKWDFRKRILRGCVVTTDGHLCTYDIRLDEILICKMSTGHTYSRKLSSSAFKKMRLCMDKHYDLYQAVWESPSILGGHHAKPCIYALGAETSVATSKEGRIYVFDCANDRLGVFTRPDECHYSCSPTELLGCPKEHADMCIVLGAHNHVYIADFECCVVSVFDFSPVM